MASRIHPDVTIREVVEALPGSERVFAAHGLPCAGCHVSTHETIRQGAAVHRLDLEALLADLRRYEAEGTVPPPRPRPAPQAGPPPRQRKPGIEHVIAVMSGKGGVGKSLVTALLACAVHRKGLRVGILDADITGPSMARMFGVSARPYAGPDGKPHPPAARSGMPIMSMNLLTDKETDAVIWRGPMVSRAIQQFFTDLEWGAIDYLFVDLPPGTSDAPLTVLQSLPVSGVVLVTTPQGLATMIVSKAIKLAQQLQTPIIGIVENMSYYLDPATGRRIELFGPSKGVQLVVESGAPLLAQLPIDPALTELCDGGRVDEYRSPDYEILAANFLKVVPTLGARAGTGS